MAQVPPVAESAVVGAKRPILVPAVAPHAPSLATAEETRLRGAAPHHQRQVAVDELAVGDGGHADIVGDGRDSSLSRWTWSNGLVSDLPYLAPMPFRDLVSRHAMQEAKKEGITLDEMEATYVDPDNTYSSAHVELREIRTRWFGDSAIEVVVDTIDGRVVTTWRKPSAR